MQEIYKTIQRYIGSQREPMTALWEELVNTESGVRQIAGVNAVRDILRREMERAGISTRVVPMENAGDFLIGEWNLESGKAPVLLIGHMDTVFSEGAAAANPFRIDEAGMAHGPGVLDMKGGLVVALYAVKALMEAGWKERPVKFLLAGDEENLHMFSNAKDVLAAESVGAIAAFNFEVGRIQEQKDQFVIGRSGGGPASITVHGVAAHSGNAPQDGRSAILEAAHKIVEIESGNDIARGRLINCGVVQGGMGANTIPDTCTITMGVRFPSSEIGREILDILKRAVSHHTVPDTTAELDDSKIMHCMDTTDGVMRLFQHLRTTAAACGFGEVSSCRVGGLSDSGVTVSSGVPTVCGMGPWGAGSHTAEEYANVESLFRRCVLAACAIYDLQDGFGHEA
ncbi:M20/M25/M40 family metallo-hydrolase [uncultured Oscillibacter sp.]|uniref:M20/M25/M40 family metallo-hydrolase n=1 Tax=uncultured Oscillibacter sp. TaxID=876091 RepID=UPI0026236FA3|nr:M20/M25/M40 family metallo-hydrolase [uncultured Oscillibacter sp.]